MRTAYLWSIYNDGKLDNLYHQYSEKFIDYLKGFDSVFTTNYDSNIDCAIGKEIYHIHGWFKQRAAVYDYESFRNQLPDAPIKDVSVDENYYYLYSNALTTHCGAYKEFQLQQYGLANDAVSKLAKAYVCNSIVKHDVDLWLSCDNKITSNMGYAVKLKVENPEIKFEDNYHFDKNADDPTYTAGANLMYSDIEGIYDFFEQDYAKLCRLYYEYKNNILTNDNAKRIFTELESSNNENWAIIKRHFENALESINAE